MFFGKGEWVLDRTSMKKIHYITQGAVTAALYVCLTLVFRPISFGAVQIRVSEVHTVLPMFTPAAVPGLFLGCLLANMLGGAVIWDVIFGSLATLAGAALGFLLRKNRWLVSVPAIIANAVTVPFILRFAYGTEIPIPLMMLYVAAGESVSCYLLGQILISALLRRKISLSDDDKAIRNDTGSAEK